jgi:hypothetical protein
MALAIFNPYDPGEVIFEKKLSLYDNMNSQYLVSKEDCCIVGKYKKVFPNGNEREQVIIRFILGHRDSLFLELKDYKQFFKDLLKKDYTLIDYGLNVLEFGNSQLFLREKMDMHDNVGVFPNFICEKEDYKKFVYWYGEEVMGYKKEQVDSLLRIKELLVEKN